MKKGFIKFLTAALVASNLFAQQNGLLLTTNSYKEVYEINKDGQKVTKYLPIGKIVPGDTVLYKNSIINNTNKTANNMVLQNPIPKHTEYVANSATCEVECEILYSVDGGKNYDKSSKLTVKDGDIKRVAKASEYTNVKWILKEPLKANSSTYVTFKTKIK